MPRFDFRDRFRNMMVMRYGLTLEEVARHEYPTILDALEVAKLRPDAGGVYGGIDNIDFFGHDMRGVPAVADLDATILAMVEQEGRALLEAHWHGGVEHDRGGYVIHLAGRQGYDLEERFGPKVAASLIYGASCPGLTIPCWFLYGDRVLEDLRVRADAWAAGPPFPEIVVRPMEPDPWGPDRWATYRVTVKTDGKPKRKGKALVGAA